MATNVPTMSWHALWFLIMGGLKHEKSIKLKYMLASLCLMADKLYMAFKSWFLHADMKKMNAYLQWRIHACMYESVVMHVQVMFDFWYNIVYRHLGGLARFRMFFTIALSNISYACFFPWQDYAQPRIVYSFGLLVDPILNSKSFLWCSRGTPYVANPYEISNEIVLPN